MSGALDFRPLLDYCESDLNGMLDCLRQAVEIESPSSSKADLERLAYFFSNQFRQQHGQVNMLRHKRAGSAVVAEFWPDASALLKPVLLLGHLDTVWDLGTLGRMPFRISGERAYGPGILDMKSGLICGLWAIRALQAAKIAPRGPVRFFLNTDEEVSSTAFRKELVEEAKRSKAVLVLEPAAAGGALKTARKGVGEFRVTVHGRAAHAGIDPAAGVNAISELARQILRIEEWARPERGITINTGVMQGGTRTNVIPETAFASLDVRVPRVRDGVALERKILGLAPANREARLEITGGINRPPMERTRAQGLFRKARAIGRELGLDVAEASTGGGSDGNFTAAAGVPTLDGLGGVGDGAHALGEHVIIRELPRRAALIAALLATLD
jgi:glutamate carboxypeptidase